MAEQPLAEDRDLFYLRRDLGRLETKVDQIPINQAANHQHLVEKIDEIAKTFIAKSEYDRDMLDIGKRLDLKVNREGYDSFVKKVEDFMDFFKKLNYAIILVIVVAVLAIIGLK